MIYTMQSTPVNSLSSDFSHYSCDEFAQVAARVIEEVRNENGCINEESLNENGKLEQKEEENGDDQEEEDKEFEFPLIPSNSVSSPAPADEIFYNGKILPMYSVSGDYSQLNGNGVAKSIEKTPESLRLPLRLLFLEDREHPSSCSSSESEELDGVAPAGTYCLWEPKTAAPKEIVECKKSNSTGSSKRLKFRNFLNRSSSEGGRDRIVFPTPDEPHSKKKDEKVSGKVAAADLFVKGGGEKRRQSPLPYRQDMVGFFGNANGTNWNLHPF